MLEKKRGALLWLWMHGQRGEGGTIVAGGIIDCFDI